MIKVIILDFDNTLVDTRPLTQIRETRQWREAYKYYEQCTVHQEVHGLLKIARSTGSKIAIFTNSPTNYVHDLIKYFEITVDYVVAFHDVSQHKPSPEGVFKILNHFNCPNHEAVYIGDTDFDRDSALNAGVEFFGVDWGTVTNLDENHRGLFNLSELIGSRLDQNSNVDIRTPLIANSNRIYLGYYLDGIKPEVLSFKNGNKTSIGRWINKTLELIKYFPKIDIVIRALGSSELVATESPTPLDELSSKIAEAIGATYLPKLLQKTRVLPKSIKLNAADRRSRISGAFFINDQNSILNNSAELTFLLVDDVYTTGATTKEISRTISEKYPKAKIYIFTLVKNIHRNDVLNSSNELQHNIQLFADLYSPMNTETIAMVPAAVARTKTQVTNLASKNYSANYARTNHNFIISNLEQYSIACESDSGKIYSAIQVLKNILQRGKPTIASRRLRSDFGLATNDTGMGTDALALISRKEPQWQRLIRGDEKKGYYPAQIFFDELFPKFLGNYKFVKQLTLPEVQISDITNVFVDQFNNAQVDFYIPQVGLIIEIDGSHHKNQKDKDNERDAFTEKLGIKTVRFTTEEISTVNYSFIEKMGAIRDHINLVDDLEVNGKITPPNGIKLSDYRKAYEQGVDQSDSRIRLTSAIRFQLLLLELVERGTIRLGELRKIVLINRDKTDFARSSISDLNEILSNLLILQGKKTDGLQIELTEFPELPSSVSEGALVIDFSILERFDDAFQVNPHIVYCYTHYFDFYRNFSQRDAAKLETYYLIDYDFFQISCTEPIKYSIDLSPGSAQREALRYFLSNLFLPFLDEVDFREGQVGIIGSALSRNGTIGLLPTGSGKSICYQLSAILQPAVSFVVCPIKSLMYDQKFDLDAIGFTRSNYITSDLNADEKTKIQREFGSGKYFFVFISPERFQTHIFRKEMSAIGLDFEFAYAVIDEAHCLSEWGHDFRTSYLNLANAIKKFAPNSTYIGLTATASVNVLRDIQTEFHVPNEFVRTPMDFSREELAFHVIDDKGLKEKNLITLVSSLNEKWNNSQSIQSKAGIIFTATVNGQKGCYYLSGRLSEALKMDVRYFSGSKPNNVNYTNEGFDKYKREVQNDFKQNKYSVLTATKAFGMGVNKGNVAFTIHAGIPGSMEALYQEAGRAGRDKNQFKNIQADCYVLLTKESNLESLDKIWDSSTNVADLKALASTLERASDVNTNLFLLTNGLDTINDESKIIFEIYKFLLENSNKNSIRVSAKYFGIEKSKFEKAIYRLSQLGLTSDWVVEDFYNGVLEVEYNCIDEDSIELNLVKTIKKYEPNFNIDDIFTSDNYYYETICEKFTSKKITKTRFIILILLLWSYDHFVYNRRQSLKTVYEQCSDLADGKISESQFKERLEAYFKFNESSQVILNMVESNIDVTRWLDIFMTEDKTSNQVILISMSELQTKREQISRFLESYKNNPCLNYLSGVVRLISDQFDDPDGERRMSASFDSIMQNEKNSALSIIQKTLKLKPLLSVDAQIRFARLTHAKTNDIEIIKLVNRELGDPYTTNILLEPLSSRLQNLTKLYKGVKN